MRLQELPDPAQKIENGFLKSGFNNGKARGKKETRSFETRFPPPAQKKPELRLRQEEKRKRIPTSEKLHFQGIPF